jgi:serine/threonine protein kinase
MIYLKLGVKRKEVEKKSTINTVFSTVKGVWRKVTTWTPQSSSSPAKNTTHKQEVARVVEFLPSPSDNSGKAKYEKYKKIKRIGAGAQSTCILASDGDRKVIMKSFITSDEFKQEVEVLKKLKHYHIVGYIDSFTFSDADGAEKRYMILEYCSGGDLSNIMKKYKKKKMPTMLFASIMVQLLRGMDFIHSMHYIHRDIKPKNILVDGKVIKIGDFGFASHINDTSAIVGGSPSYLSPEFKDKQNQFNPKVDVWSIGCTAIEMITNKERDLKLLLDSFKKHNQKGHFLDTLWEQEIGYPMWILEALRKSLDEDHNYRSTSKELLITFEVNMSAMQIQRVWRGHKARKIVQQTRTLRS